MNLVGDLRSCREASAERQRGTLRMNESKTNAADAAVQHKEVLNQFIPCES